MRFGKRSKFGKHRKSAIILAVILVLTLLLSFAGITTLYGRKASSAKANPIKANKESNNIKVSVIVPVYKAEKYLKECIDSIRNQTLKDIEIICVDDGSPDNCGNMLDEYAKEDNRVKVIHQQNQGASAARNRGLDEAKGEYVRFSDDDDTMYPNACEVSYTKAKAEKADILYDDMPYEKVLDGPIYDELKVAVWSGVYRTDFLNENNIRFYEPVRQFGEDHAFNLLCIPKAKKIVCIKDKLYNYYGSNPDNTCNNSTAAKEFPKKHVMVVDYIYKNWSKEGYFEQDAAKISFLTWVSYMNMWKTKETNKMFIKAIGPELLKDSVLDLLSKENKEIIKKMVADARS